MYSITDGTEILYVHDIGKAVLQHPRLRRAFCYDWHEVTKPIRRLEDLNLALALLYEGAAM